MEKCLRTTPGSPGCARLAVSGRYVATYWTHVGPTMAEPLHRRVGCDRLGLPSDGIPLLP